MLFDVGGEGAELGRSATGGDQKLVVVEQFLVALAGGAALLAVAQQLVDGLGDGFFDPCADLHSMTPTGRPLRKSTMSGTMWCSVPGDVHFELADGHELVVVRVGEIHIAHGGAFLARGVVDGYAGVLQQQAQNVLVVLDQAGVGRDRDAPYYLGHLVVGQEGVDAAQRGLQLGQQHHLVESGAEALRRRLHLLPADHVPAQTLQVGREKAPRRWSFRPGGGWGWLCRWRGSFYHLPVAAFVRADALDSTFCSAVCEIARLTAALAISRSCRKSESLRAFALSELNDPFW